MQIYSIVSACHSVFGFFCYENKIFLETNFTKMELFQETFRKDSMIAKLKSNLKQIFI